MKRLQRFTEEGSLHATSRLHVSDASRAAEGTCHGSTLHAAAVLPRPAISVSSRSHTWSRRGSARHHKLRRGTRHGARRMQQQSSFPSRHERRSHNRAAVAGISMSQIDTAAARELANHGGLMLPPHAATEKHPFYGDKNSPGTTSVIFANALLQMPRASHATTLEPNACISPVLLTMLLQTPKANVCQQMASNIFATFRETQVPITHLLRKPCNKQPHLPLFTRWRR